MAQDLLQRLRSKYVATGDLASIALARGWAKRVNLTSDGRILHIDGKFHFDPSLHVQGFWKLPTTRRKFSTSLQLASEGFWVGDDAHVRVGREVIEVVAYGKTYISRPNICGVAEDVGGGGRDVVVHIVGTVRRTSGSVYTAFRCSEWILPLSPEPLFDRFAFDKRKVYNGITGRDVEFREVFVKKGRVVEVLVNPSCREYSETVYKLYGSIVECRDF
jgi:hypothetical protein